MDTGAWIIGAIAREAMLFAAIGFLVGGVDDLIVDLVFLVRRVWRGGEARTTLAGLPPTTRPGRLAIFVPAWDEAEVIGAMLRTALGRFAYDDYRLYVGVYPNDRATITAVAAVAADEPRVRMVIGPRDGPTTVLRHLLLSQYRWDLAGLCGMKRAGICGFGQGSDVAGIFDGAVTV